MSDKDSTSNIDLLASLDKGELGVFEFWKVRNKKFCEALKGEGENFIVWYYLAKKEIKYILSGGYKIDSKNVDETIKAIEDLKIVRDVLNEIADKLRDSGEVDKGLSVLGFVWQLDNDDLKWSKRKLANYAKKQHQKYGADYEIPEIIMGETWGKIKHCIVPKLRLWHIAFMIDPFNLWGKADHTKAIMTDLYDAIESGCLNANTSPPKIPKMIDEGQTIDRWEITLKDFKTAIYSGCMKDYFKPYIKVWESYIKVRTRAFGRIENPEPFLKESLEMTGNAVDSDDFIKALFSNIRSQKEQGINDKSKAFQDAMKAVEPIEGYRIIVTALPLVIFINK